MLPQEPLEQEEAALLNSACVSASEAEHTLPSHHLSNMEVANLLSTYSEKHTAVERSLLCKLAESWNSSSSNSVVFVLQGTASN